MSKETKSEKRERSKESKVRNKRNTDGDGYSCDNALRPRAYNARVRAASVRPAGLASTPDTREVLAPCGLRRVKAKRKAEVKSRLRRWLAKLEAEGIQDPVPIIVNHAVKVTHGTKDDRNKWMKIANRNINSFMGVLMEFEYDLEKPDMPRLRNPVAAFQARLNRVLPYPVIGGGK